MGVQVQTATRDGQGNPLSILNRQFISFSYGGKNIEDFDLLVIFNGDRLSKEIYAPFNDTTTEQAELDGQMFWRSNFKAGQINFSLATDGMTSKQLEDFKKWFEPGIEKELILSEYHNRGILARVSAPPQMSLLPFEEEVEVKIGNIVEKTKTSLYKGEISLSFVMDEPYWYAKESVLQGDITSEVLKLVFEDNIPHKEMLKTSCLLGGNLYFDYEKNELKDFNSFSGLNINSNQKDVYLYYCGTAPARPIISFETKLLINEDNGEIFFNGDNSPYISFGSDLNYKKLKFGLPSIFSSYNNALKTVSDYLENNGTDIFKLRALLRDSIYNYYARSFIMSVIDKMRSDKEYIDINGKIDRINFKKSFIDYMKKFYDDSNLVFCSINNQTGEVIIKTKVLLNSNDEKYSEITENAGNMIKSNYLSIEIRGEPKDGIINSSNCLLVKSNIELSNFKIDYKYKYL